MPFEALQTGEEKYVIDRAAVAYVPSLSALKEMRRRRSPRVANRVQPPTLLVFANPTLPKEMVDRMQTTYDGLRLPEMSAEASEIQKLQSIYGPTRVRSYTGGSATKDRLRLDVSSAGVVHFETPAIMDRAVPMYSFVTLSPDATLRDDGLLRLSEITNFNSKGTNRCVAALFRNQEGNSDRVTR